MGNGIVAYPGEERRIGGGNERYPAGTRRRSHPSAERNRVRAFFHGDVACVGDGIAGAVGDEGLFVEHDVQIGDLGDLVGIAETYSNEVIAMNAASIGKRNESRASELPAYLDDELRVRVRDVRRRVAISRVPFGLEGRARDGVVGGGQSFTAHRSAGVSSVELKVASFHLQVTLRKPPRCGVRLEGVAHGGPQAAPLSPGRYPTVREEPHRLEHLVELRALEEGRVEPRNEPFAVSPPDRGRAPCRRSGLGRGDAASSSLPSHIQTKKPVD